MREEVQNWFLQAKEDLSTAEANLQIGKYYAAAFFSQQAAEKALKAVAVAVLKQSIRSHSLVDLAGQVKLPETLYPNVAELNADYTVARYPDAASGLPYKQYTLGIASRKIKSAKQVLEWAEKCLGK